MASTWFSVAAAAASARAELGTVDPEHRSGASAGGLHRKPASVAIKVEDAPPARQAGDKEAVVALVEKPAGLLPGERVDREHRAVFADVDRSADFTQRHPRLGRQALPRAHRAVVA